MTNSADLDQLTDLDLHNLQSKAGYIQVQQGQDYVTGYTWKFCAQFLMEYSFLQRGICIPSI